MAMNEQQVAELFRDSLDRWIEDTGRSLQAAAVDVAAYAAQQSAVLAASVGEPGWQGNIERARANVMAQLGKRSIDEADELDRRLWDIVRTGFLFGAHALAAI